MQQIPTGTVTFLFTDIEGSSRRWDSQREAMAQALARHDVLVRGATEAHAGYVFHTAGDAFGVAFASPDDAITGAIAAQRALAAEDWSAVAPGFDPLAVRMALHTGLAELRDGDYFGPPVNRAARLMSAGHGGQVLLSLATQQLVRDRLPVGVVLRDLGAHRLKDLKYAEHIFQLVVEGLPDVTTLPVTAEVLAGYDRPLADEDLLPAVCPYRGLHAFREEDARFFFGREAFTDRLARDIAARPMVGVIGPSGSGKSSVVFAGLLPRLRVNPPPVGGLPPGSLGAARTDGGPSSVWAVMALRPGAEPFAALAAVLVERLDPGLAEASRLVEIGRLATGLREGSVSVLAVARRIHERHGDLPRLLLVADQFEELYTLCRDDGEQRRFQDLLFEAVAAGGGNGPGAPVVKLALTLRADFMGHALMYRPFADAIQDHNMVLGPMTGEELARSITNPAELQGRAFESGLVERILADVGDEAGQLPLLEFALTRLWEQQAGGWLTHEAYEAIGRVEGAVARHADAVVDGLAPMEHEGCRRVFVQMVRPGEGTEDTRRLATKEELGEDWPLVRRLADARLVVTNRDAATGRETVEVVHEALIRSWGRLKSWMTTDRAFRTWQERVRFAAKQWVATGEDEGALLRGVPLAEAEGWLAERGAALGEGERAFVAAGLAVRDRKAREREARVQRELAAARKMRRLAGGLAGALAVAVGMAGLALVSRQQAARDARFAQARELAAAALVNLDVDPERSALLALQAVSVTQRADGIVLPEVVTTLHRAVPALHVRYALGHNGAVRSADYSPDGTRIATTSADGTGKIWDAAIGRDLFAVTGRGDVFPSIAFSRDGQRVATADGDAVARVWDAAMRHELFTLTGHGDRVVSIAFSPDGTQIATASDDKTARVWDAATGHELFTLAGHGDKVWDVAFSPDGRRIATRSDDKTAKIWDAASGRELVTLPSYQDEAPLVMFSPDGQRIATQSDDMRARILDAATGRELFAVAGHDNGAPFVVFSPDGQRIAATTGNDHTAKVWDAHTGRELFTLVGHGDVVWNVVFSPDAARIATASQDKTAKIWDATTGRELLTLAGHAASVGQVAYSPGGDLVATGSDDKRVMFWDAESGKLSGVRTGHTGQVLQLDFSPDGQTLLSHAVGDPNARVWDVAPDREVLAPDGQFSSDVAFSPDGRWFATTLTHTAVLRDASTGREIRRFSGHTEDVLDVDFSPDGRWLATAGSDDKTARVWDVATGKSHVTLCCHKEYVQQVTFSPDGRHVATASWDKTAKVWDAATGKLVQTLEGHTEVVHAVVYSPDGKTLATVSDDATARLWGAATGKPVRTLVGHGGPISYAWFSPDGRSLATASDDDTVGIWDVDSGKRVRTIDGLMGGVWYIAYSPDGLMLVGVGANGAAKAWDVESGEEAFSLAGEVSHAVALAISPDGGRLLMASNAGTGMYVLRLPDLIALARARLTRTLTPEECRQYLHVDTCPEE